MKAKTKEFVIPESEKETEIEVTLDKKTEKYKLAVEYTCHISVQ